MKCNFIFLLGRPGCGKSVLYKELQKKIIKSGISETTERIDDYPKLLNLFQEDDKREKINESRLYSRKSGNGGYVVTNDEVWDKILKELNNDILKSTRQNHLIFIEFSRPKNISALENFSDDIISKSLVLYLDADFELCWQRNVQRHEKALANNIDDHLVSREEMESTYKYDDRDELIKSSRFPVIIVDTKKEGIEHLPVEAEKVVNFIINN